MIIELHIAGEDVVAEIVGHDEMTSPHTGNSLERLELEFEVTGEQTASISALLASGGEVSTGPMPGMRFGVASSYSSSTNGGPTRFHITAEEAETIMATTVTLNGTVALTPYRYREHANGPALTITFGTTTSGDASDALEALILDRRPGVYFPVVREGISVEPRPMRVGQCLWQPNEDGSVRHRVVLVDEAYDQVGDGHPAVGLFEPERTRTAEAIAELQNLIGGLIERLVGADLLTPEDADLLTAQAHEVTQSQFRQFYRADDIDDFLE